MGEDPTTRPRLQTISFEFISDSQLDTERPTRFLLDSANSLLEWYMFSGINPVQYIAETVLSFSFLWFYLSQQRMETTYKMPSFVIDE